MAQRTILFLGGSMSGTRLPVDDLPSNHRPLKVIVHEPPVVQRRGGSIPPLVSGYRTEDYAFATFATFGALQADLMVLSDLNPATALGQYLRGEVVR